MQYPFAALVGQETLKRALLLTAVDPRIGGVLVSGEKGTAKSTAARALAEILPPLRVVAGCPFHCRPDEPWPACPHCSGLDARHAIELPMPLVTLPLGATEDRVIGTLDFERALREGRKAIQPGLLATAHRGILYVDEVNLLADHLVDVLLDAAAMGTNSIQREGIELSHPARFMLIGTMNPEEGELRPQLLDRFGLMVRVAGPREPELRAEVVRRRLAFDESPAAFAARWETEQAQLRERIEQARGLLAAVRIDDALLQLMTRLCCELEIDGLRGDIVLYKTTRALAALDGRTTATSADVREAAELALVHRRRRKPFDHPTSSAQELDDFFEGGRPKAEGGGVDFGHDGASQDDGSREAEGTDRMEPDDDHRLFPLPSASAVRPVELERATSSPRLARGRRNAVTAERSGQYVRATASDSPTDLAIDATLRAAAQRGGWDGNQLTVEPADLRQKVRSGRAGTLILFVVDASGSMAARRRMEAVKGTVLGLLVDAYHQRDQVAVIAVRGVQAQLLLPPTSSVELAQSVLQTLPTGGRTPLAHAFTLASEVIARARRSDSEGLALVVLLSDGKANVGLPQATGEPFAQALATAGQLAAARVPALVLDTDAGLVRVGRASELAAALGAEYLPLDELSSESLTSEVRRRCQALSVRTPSGVRT